MSEIKVISAEDFTQKLKDNSLGDALILDVRSQAEMDAYCLSAEHTQMPLHKLDVTSLQNKPESEIYVLCKMGGRAMKAAEYLSQAGIKNLTVIDGGMQGCKSCGADVEGNNTDPSDNDMAVLMSEAQKSVQKFMGQ